MLQFPYFPPYAVLIPVNEAPRLTKIEGVGVIAGSSSVPSIYAPDTVKQQPQGTVTDAVVFTCQYSPAAAGVTIATLYGITTPLRVIPIAIGVTAPPVGI